MDEATDTKSVRNGKSKTQRFSGSDISVQCNVDAYRHASNCRVVSNDDMLLMNRHIQTVIGVGGIATTTIANSISLH